MRVRGVRFDTRLGRWPRTRRWWDNEAVAALVLLATILMWALVLLAWEQLLIG